MYHIRRADNHDERSLHMENDEGFANAMEEANLRAGHTNAAHQIVDDNGRIAAIVHPAAEETIVIEANGPEGKELIDGMARVAVKPWKVFPWWYWASAYFTATVLFRIIFGEVLF